MIKKKPELKAIERFLFNKKILIVDQSVGVRSSIMSVFKELGSKPLDIQLATSYDQANQIIQKSKPHILVTEFQFEGGSCFDLLRTKNQILKDFDHSISILITGNSRESSVAQAVEEEIDLYLLKPFSQSSFKNYLCQHILSKLQSNPYHQLINQGRAALSEGQNQKALAFFEQAALSGLKPALAHFYLGQLHLQNNQLKLAELSFREGLKLNPNHFRCMGALFDLLYQLQNHQEAYSLSNAMIKQFPFSPHKLEIIIKLLVVNKAFGDLDALYEYYLGLDQRPPSVIKSMLAALVVAVGYFLETGKMDQALDYAKKASISSGRAFWVHKEIVHYFLKFELFEKAQNFLNELPANSKSSPEFVALDFEVFDKTADVREVIEKGRRLLADGINQQTVKEIIKKRSIQIGIIEE